MHENACAALGVTICLSLYVAAAWRSARKDNPLLKVDRRTQVVNLGSTYAYYGLDYGGFAVNGANLANFPQYLDYDQIALEKAIKKLAKGTKVLITFPNFVFAGAETDPARRRYYEALAPWEMKRFSLGTLLLFLFKAAAEPFTHGYRKERDKWKGHEATDGEKRAHAKKRIRDWEDPDGQVRIPSVKKADVTERHLERIARNQRIVMDMIRSCAEHGMETYLLLFPLSSVMKEEIADECLEAYLRKPLRAVLREAGRAGYDVRLLDYSGHKGLSDMGLYMNGDCFGRAGRRKFTEIVLRDIGLVQ